MKTNELLQQFRTLLESREISKFQRLIELLNNGLGQQLYDNVKDNDSSLLNDIRGLGIVSPHETVYILNEIYQFLTKQEEENNEKLNLAILYFWIGDILYQQRKNGFGKYYLKAYIQDLGYHTTPAEGGAAHAIRAYCYLGEPGLEIIRKEIKKRLNVQDENLLGDELKKLDRMQIESLAIHIENIISLENNEDFLLPLPALKKLISEIEPLSKKGKGNREKARLLENLCQLVFGSITGFRYKLDERSKLFQIDGIVSNTSKHPFLIDLGKNIVVEAKQYFHRNSIDRKIVDILAMNMIRINASSAFLITSGRLANSAFKEIYHHYIRTGNIIIFMNLNDLKDLSEQKTSLPVIISKRIRDVKSFRKYS